MSPIKNNILITLILFLSLVIRLAVLPYGTFPDINAYREWSHKVVTDGFGNFYYTSCIYLPGYIYVLYLIGNYEKGLGGAVSSDVVYKLPSIIADLIVVYLIYLLLKRFLSRAGALVPAFIYGISPCIFANSAMWGQTDAAAFLPTFLSFCFFVMYFTAETIIKRRLYLVLSGLFLGLSFVTKPNGVFLLPFFLLFIVFGKKFKLRTVIFELLMILSSSLIIFLVLFIPFTGNKNFFRFVGQVSIESVDCHNITNYAAFNFWKLYKDWSPDSGRVLFFSYKEWGRVALIYYLGVLSILVVGKIRNANDSKKYVVILSESLALFYLFWYLFTTGVHERHIFPVFGFLAVTAGFKKTYWVFYLILMIASFLNLGYVSKGIVFNQNYLYTPELLKLYPLSIILAWAFMMVSFVRRK